MRRGLAWISCLMLVATATASELTVATYNVENYVSANRLTAAGYRKDYPKPEAAKAALRTVLRAMNADVVVFQEMGPRRYLEELRRDLQTAGLNYPHAVLLEAADADRHVAVLSRRPLVRVVEHTRLTFRYFEGLETVKRGLLEVVIATPQGDMTLWALHLKSRYQKRKDDPESAKRRAGEAMAIREWLLAHSENPRESAFLILGDFNDTKSSAAVRYLTRKGKMVISQLLPAVDSRGEGWTYHYRRDDSYSRVDHILVSPALQGAVKGGAVRIFDLPAVREASDHRPVMVTLTWPE